MASSKEGILRKLSVGTGVSSIFGKNWQDRYFVLEIENGLSYYDSASAKACGKPAKRQIPIAKADPVSGRVRLISKPTSAQNSAVEDSTTDFILVFPTGKKTEELVMRAPDRSTHDEWCIAIQSHIALIGAGMVQHIDPNNAKQTRETSRVGEETSSGVLAKLKSAVFGASPQELLQKKRSHWAGATRPLLKYQFDQFAKLGITDPGEPRILRFCAAFKTAVEEALEFRTSSDTSLWISSVAKTVPSAERSWSAFERSEHPIRVEKALAQTICCWVHFDADHSGDLQESELLLLFGWLNYPEEKASLLVKTTLSRLKKKSLTFPEFQELLHDGVDWAELGPYWSQLTGGKPEIESVPVETLSKFLQTVQGEEPEVAAKAAAAAAAIDENNDVSKKEFFSFIIDSEANALVDPLCTQPGHVYQNMSLPLTQYFCSSSHNTYLTGDQLKSDSSTEMYVNALRDGCRCVELDCWDGPNGEPIIYHGFTMTSKISFESVIAAIKENAWVTSKYPVVLSLEVHTSVAQQSRMATIMKEYFADELALPTFIEANSECDLTPEKYQKKFILKGKRLSNSNQTQRQAEEESNSDEDDSKAPEIKEAKKGEKPPKISKDLSDLIIMESTNLATGWPKSFEQARPYQCCSLTETKSCGFVSKSIREFAHHNTLRFSRIYPSGARVDSSNYHPQPHWNAGAQIVALNWQTTESYELRLNKGRFADNGNCGYLLKPEYLRTIASVLPVEVKPIKLTIKVLSAFCLPKPGQSVKGEVVDPYVKIFIEGPEVKNTDYFETHAIDDNGFHPVWSGGAASECSFKCPIPEMSTLVFQVFDKDKMMKDTILAERFAPVHLLRKGVRCVKLKDSRSRMLTNTFLLVEMNLDEFR